MGTADAATAPAEDFGEFWSPYPRKVGRAETLKRWKRLIAKDRAAAVLAAVHLAAYVQESNAELQFVPHPATFIGPKRTWEDWKSGVPPGYVQIASAGHSLNQVVRRPLCPKCAIELTFDEIGEHCPVCSWRVAS